jgi:TRAP-type C4-dicarboxylate transport system permease small subunit
MALAAHPPDGGRLHSTPLILLDRLLAWAMHWSLVVLMSVMTAVVFAQVVLRYGFNGSIDWADEVSRLSFVWTVFLAIPLAIREQLHIGMEILVIRLPQAWRAPLARLCDLLGAGLMGLLCWHAVILARDQWDEKMATVSASAAWFVVAVAVGSALSVFELLRLAVLGLRPEGRLVVE